MVLLMLNGRGPFRFAVETGAPLLTLRANVARALGYAVADRSQWVTLDSVAIGAATFRHVEAKLFATGVSDSFGESDLGGLLGLNLFYDLLLTLDPVHATLRLTRGALPPVNQRDIVALARLGHQWYTMESWVNGTHAMAFLDTQDPGTFRTTPSQVTESQFVHAPVVTGYATGPSLGVQEGRMGRLNGSVRVGAVSFQQPLVTITPVPSEFLQRWIIGWGALRHFTMTMDQRNRRLRLTPVAADTVIAPPPTHARGHGVGAQ